MVRNPLQGSRPARSSVEDCSDITNNWFGISGETVPEDRNLHIYYVQSGNLVSSGSNIWVRCVTPHSSPTRGC